MAVPLLIRTDVYPEASLSQLTIDAVPIALTAALANYFMIPGTSIIFDAIIQAHNSDGAGNLVSVAAWHKRGVYKQITGGVDCVQVGAVVDMSPSFIDAALIGVEVELRVGQDGPKVWITGKAATAVYWGVQFTVSRMEGAA